MIKVLRAEFMKGLESPDDLQEADISRIGFAGRSNVGKSTLINRLLNRKNLARASSTPGRTREFNLYRAELALSSRERRVIELLDFPGFGYAKFSRAERRILHKKILGFFENSPALDLLCLLNDSRREPEQDELELRNAAASAGTQVLVLATKTDKLKRNEVKIRLREMASAYGLETEDIIAAGSDIMTNSLWERIRGCLLE